MTIFEQRRCSHTGMDVRRGSTTSDNTHREDPATTPDRLVTNARVCTEPSERDRVGDDVRRRRPSRTTTLPTITVMSSILPPSNMIPASAASTANGDARAPRIFDVRRLAAVPIMNASSVTSSDSSARRRTSLSNRTGCPRGRRCRR